ncbi:MAG: DUF2099 family protein [Archaeoglobales archaeon]|nr:DUF2099 family protein [Archaeoglobales archaeon]
MSEHIMEMLGRARVVVEDGKVIDASEPIISYCPLFEKLHNIKRITKIEVIKNAEYRIKNFGLFTKNRIVEDERIYATFGASEILSCCLRKKILDAVVIASDCAGTVVTSNPKIVQGLGGRLSGLIKTSPIEEVIERIERAGGFVIDKKFASIDQVKGVEVARKMGFERIGVTLLNPEDAKRCDATLKFAVHTTGVNWSAEDLKEFDLVTLCASKRLRELSKDLAKAQAGESIPVVAISKIGKEALLERAKEIDKILISSTNLPKLGKNQPEPLV